MAYTQIYRGTTPNDRTGTVLREMARIINENFAAHDTAITAAQTTANSASTAAAAANANANTRILTSARGVPNGVANLNALGKLTYSSEILMAAMAGNHGRTFLGPAALHSNSSATITGCFVIKQSGVTAMHTVHARAFNYGTGQAGRGIAEFSASLYHTTGQAGGTAACLYQSQFGTWPIEISAANETATGRRCFIVGTPTTQWSFPMLTVLDATSHRSTIALANGGETVDVEWVTNLDAYNSVTAIPDTGPYATANAALALANTLSTTSFPIRPVPANGTDFNNVRDPGIYPVPTQAIGGTLLNMPPGMSTGIILVYPVSGSSSVIQVGIRSDARLSGKRRFASAAWNDWDLDLSKSNGVSLEGFLANAVDLNTLTTPGTIYGISSNATGGTLVNWPEALAGAVEVVPWASQGYVLQRGYLYSAGRQIVRFQTAPTTWQPWREYAMLSSLGGTLPVANIPTGIPVANITGAAPTMQPIITEPLFNAIGQSGLPRLPALLSPTGNTTVATVGHGAQIGGGGSNAALVLAASSHTSQRLGARIAGARTTAAPGVLTTALPANSTALTIDALGADGVDTYRLLGTIEICADATAVSPTDSSGRIEFRPTPVGSTIPTTAMTVKSSQVLLAPGVQLAVGTGGATGITKAMVGLPNADNTSDANKPVSTATTAQLNTKVGIANSETITGIKTFSNNTVFTGGFVTLQTGSDSSPILKLLANDFQQLLRANRVTQATELVNNANTVVTHRFYDNGLFEPAQGISVNNAMNAPKGIFRGYGPNQGYGIVCFAAVAGDAGAVLFQNSGGVPVGGITTNNSGTYYGTTSDYRLKNEVGPVVGARRRIRNLRTFLGEFKASPGILRTMLFAHEIADWMPYVVIGRKDAVHDDGSINPQQVDYAGMVPDLIAALNEEIDDNIAMRATIADMLDWKAETDRKLAELAALIQSKE